MCGRYTLTTPKRLIERFPKYRFPAMTPRYNVAPTQEVVALRNDANGAVSLVPWGMHGNINARVETVGVKPSFRESLRARRAVVFADGYYEWQTRPDGKQPFFIHLPDESPFTFAALYDETGCVIITTDASPDICAIHDRMPVILSDEFRDAWLASVSLESEAACALLAAPLTDLVARPVSTAVNRVANESPVLIARVEPPEQPGLF